MTLNEVIKDIQQSYSLPAHVRNALHGATLGHPWCADKSLDRRKIEVLFAIAGRISGRDECRIRKAVG